MSLFTKIRNAATHPLATTKKVYTTTIKAPIASLAAGDPGYQKLTTGKWSMNPDKNFNRAVQKNTELDSSHRVLGVSDHSFNKSQKVGAAVAGIFYGGGAAYSYLGAGGTAGGVGVGGAGAGAGAGAGEVGLGTQLLNYIEKEGGNAIKDGINSGFSTAEKITPAPALPTSNSAKQKTDLSTVAVIGGLGLLAAKVLL